MGTHKPSVLMILDGWGDGPDAPDNAIARGKTPHWDHLTATRPIAHLTTHGLAVGLPEGQMGNSEVGHMNIGAGRVVYQDLTRISKAIEDGSFIRNEALLFGIDQAVDQQSTLHIFGLLSDGGVHSHEDHFHAVIDLALARGVTRIGLHIFTDGRDVAPRSCKRSIDRLLGYQHDERICFGSVSGRYYAMDRDHRWERTELAWAAIALGESKYQAEDLKWAIQSAYERGEDDEFIHPTVIGSGCPIQNGDIGLFVNFRSDRARQLSHALIDECFEGFERCDGHCPAHLVTMTQYDDQLKATVAFPPQSVANGIGEVVSRAGLSQLRVAETEKYAHVTYFFNGGEETVFPGEDRRLIPSPKVATYDLCPEMSASEVGDVIEQAILQQSHDLIVANLANPDMVGHTGDMGAAIKAVEAVDEVIGRVVSAATDVGAEVLITADHGNAEQMTNAETGQPHTAHTTNTVPFIYVGPRAWRLRDTGTLRDIAPTLLTLLGIAKPTEMTGESLLVSNPKPQ